MGRLLIDGSTQISPQQIDNLPGSIIRYKGAAPAMPRQHRPPVLTRARSALPKELRDCGRFGHGREGRNPPASRRARHSRSTTTRTRRFLRLQRAIEDFVCEVARQVVHAVAQCDGYSVTYQGRKALESVRAPLTCRSPTRLRVQCFPISFFASTPAANSGSFWQSSSAPGFADQLGLPRGDRQALDFPDIESALATVTSAHDLWRDSFRAMARRPNDLRTARVVLQPGRAPRSPSTPIPCSGAHRRSPTTDSRVCGRGYCGAKTCRRRLHQCPQNFPGAEAPPELPPGPMPGVPN